jgi:glycosyltransferase involved in cell wall biosynthesis
MKLPELNIKLEIILITYNRVQHLQNTFNQIFSNESPIKNLEITILNNNSTDGTTELIEEYRKIFPNIKHIIHNRNIGGNANIARSFEIASKEYVWVLCDDDEYNWSNWSEVEEAIDNKIDLIVVANYVNPKRDITNLIKQLTFVPAGIYRTEHINNEMIINAYYNVSTMFPQIAIFAEYINKNRIIHICNEHIIRMVVNDENSSYIRGSSKDIAHPYMKNNYWHFGFVNAIQVFRDSRLRAKLIDRINPNPPYEKLSIFDLQRINKYFCNKSKKNMFDYYCALNLRQRILYKLNVLVHLTIFRVVFIYITPKSIILLLFSCVTIHLWDFCWIPKREKKKI